MKIFNTYLGELKTYKEFNFDEWYDKMTLNFIFHKESSKIVVKDLKYCLNNRSIPNIIIKVLVYDDKPAIPTVFYYNGKDEIDDNKIDTYMIAFNYTKGKLLSNCSVFKEFDYITRYALNKFISINNKEIVKLCELRIPDLIDGRKLESIEMSIKTNAGNRRL